MGLLHYLYCKSCFQKNWSLNSFYEVSFSWGCFCISINLPYVHVWNTIVTSGLVPLVAPSCIFVFVACPTIPNCWASYKNEYAGLLILYMLLLLNPRLIAEMWLVWVFSIGITLVDVLQNWLNCFHFLFLKGGLHVILIDYIISFSPFLDVTTMSISTISFLAQLGSKILSL